MITELQKESYYNICYYYQHFMPLNLSYWCVKQPHCSCFLWQWWGTQALFDIWKS